MHVAIQTLHAELHRCAQADAFLSPAKNCLCSSPRSDVPFDSGRPGGAMPIIVDKPMLGMQQTRKFCSMLAHGGLHAHVKGVSPDEFLRTKVFKQIHNTSVNIMDFPNTNP